MRQTLFRVLLDQPWAVWAIDPATGIEGIGICILVLGIGAIWLFLAMIPSMRSDASSSHRSGKSASRDQQQVAVRSLSTELMRRGGTLVLLVVVAHFAGPLIGRPSFPVFGYGFMLLIGFLSAIWFARHRARLEGFDPEMLFDLSFWILIPGIIGGRLEFLWQKWETVLAGKSGTELLTTAVNLSGGGLVLIGAMVGGTIGFFAFCYRRKINALKLADVVIPSAFVGIGFGRLGCLMNGCCFGDPCSLPWAVTFPAGSVPFDVLVYRGLVDPDTAATMPMHPTQIYSSLNAFILAFVTATYFHRRRHVGDVFALALILYPISRFTIEILRNDEFGQFGTGLTISQLYSLAIFAAGIGLYWYLSFRGRTLAPARARPALQD